MTSPAIYITGIAVRVCVKGVTGIPVMVVHRLHKSMTGIPVMIDLKGLRVYVSNVPPGIFIP